jgi:hypothetical protein
MYIRFYQSGATKRQSLLDMFTRRSSFIAKHPLFCLLILSAIFAIALFACAVFLLRYNFIPELRDTKTLQDISAVFQGTVGGAVALAGSMVAIYLAMNALQASRRQEVADSQSFLNDLIDETYQIFVKLNFAIDDLVESVTDLFSNKQTIGLMEEIRKAHDRDPEGDQAAQSQFESAAGKISDALVDEFLTKFSSATLRTSHALQEIAFSSKASSIWHYALNQRKANQQPEQNRGPPDTQSYTDEVGGLFPLTEISKDFETLHAAATFFRRISAGLSELENEKERERKEATYGIIRLSVIMVLLFGRDIAPSELGANPIAFWLRVNLALLGNLLYLGDTSYMASFGDDSSKGEKNISLLIIRTILRGTPDKNTIEKYIHDYFYQALVRDSELESIYTRQMQSLDEISSANSHLKVLLKNLDDLDTLLTRPFASLAFARHHASREATKSAPQARPPG